MQNLIFSLNATMPVFLLMVLGFVLSMTGLFEKAFAAKVNTFVFRIALPVMLFYQMATTDFLSAWDWRFVLFCLGATILSVGICWLLSLPLKNRAQRSEFLQASYRSSAAILGLAYIQNLYGTSVMGPLMIAACVPAYNIGAVIILAAGQPEQEGEERKHGFPLKRVLTNPILIGVLSGILWSVIGLPMPVILGKTLSNLGSLATPLGLLSMGASIEVSGIRENLWPSVAASFNKLILLVAVFVPLAAIFFRGEQLIAILIMQGGATTVSCYTMARNMGYEGKLTANAVMLTTFFSTFTLTFYIWLLKTLALI